MTSTPQTRQLAHYKARVNESMKNGLTKPFNTQSLTRKPPKYHHGIDHSLAGYSRRLTQTNKKCKAKTNPDYQVLSPE